MMKTAIQNGKIVTYTDAISVQEKHSLIIENDIILDITPDSEVAKIYPDAKTIDATNKAIFSGFANFRTSLFFETLIISLKTSCVSEINSS